MATPGTMDLGGVSQSSTRRFGPLAALAAAAVVLTARVAVRGPHSLIAAVATRTRTAPARLAVSGPAHLTTGRAAPRSPPAMVPEAHTESASVVRHASPLSFAPVALLFGLAAAALRSAYRLRSGLPLAMVMAAGAGSDEDKVVKSEAEWRAELTPQQYQVLRQKGTEPPRTGKYDKFYPKEGYFVCAGCRNPLYSAAAKFDSGCGWPAFDKCYKGSVRTEIDGSLFMRRIEILCAKCDGHLGHVFEKEGFTPTMERHCVNSVSVDFVPTGSPPAAEEEPVLK